MTGRTSASRRGDAPALVEAARSSAAGVAAVVRRRRAILRETLSELVAVTMVMRHVGIRESVALFDMLVLGWAVLSIHAVRELAVLAATTQREAYAVLARQDDRRPRPVARAKHR